MKLPEKYFFQKYVYFSRWTSYWHQLNETLKFEPSSVLLIGKGDGLVGDALKKIGVEVKTLDFDSELMPDICASVENIPIRENSFDVVLCAEVLEHLPFEKFEKCLLELRRVSCHSVVLSLPHFGPPIKFCLKLPFLKEIKVSSKIYFPRQHKFNGHHYWEIGKKGYSSTNIKKIITRHFKIVKEFIPFDNQYHHFYILKKLL